MKIWNVYGSEHSMKLVMIGSFKTVNDAKKTQKLIEELTEGLKDKIEIGINVDHYPDEVSDLLRKNNCYSLAPYELEHFLYGDNITQQEGNKIILKTDESEVSAFFKLMIMKGAKIEIFSTHDYPE